jgi:hypothetical protein
MEYDTADDHARRADGDDTAHEVAQERTSTHTEPSCEARTDPMAPMPWQGRGRVGCSAAVRSRLSGVQRVI